MVIQKSELPFGKRIVTVYKPTQKGIEFCRSILEPYERIFPRSKESVVIVNNINNTGNNNVAAKPAIKSGRQEQQEVEDNKRSNSSTCLY